MHVVFLMGEFLELKLKVHGRYMCLDIVDTDKMFHKMTVLIYTPIIRVWEFSGCRLSCFPFVITVSVITDTVRCLLGGWLGEWFSHSGGSVMISQCHFNLYFPVNWSYWVYFHVFGYLYIFFLEVIVQIFCPIIN